MKDPILLLIDCMEFMGGCDDNHFDLAVVDPPYGIGNDWIKNNEVRSKIAKAGEAPRYPNLKKDRPSPEFFVELRRVSKNQIIWGANHLCDLFDASGPGWVYWKKDTTGNFSDGEIAYTSFKQALLEFHYPWNGMYQGFHADKRLNERRIHPSQKPVALYDWLFNRFAAPGQRILDTHLGSGSSAIAAARIDCEFVGTEIDPTYYWATCERVDLELRQQELL